MITAVDTNVLVDVFGADPRFGRASAQALRQARREGAVIACDIVWAEAIARFDSSRTGVDAMAALRVEFSPTDLAAAISAAEAWHAYRGSGSGRDRLIADFVIGAHARVQADRLLTRDRGFVRRWFADLHIVDPSA